MPISWNEIKSRAITFTKEWEKESSEDAEAKSFWDNFFAIFGISRRRVAVFEKAIKKQDGAQGYIDLLWKGVILVEHKSRGKNLDKAFEQAKGYFPNLKEHELPKYILVSDFAKFRLYNLETDETHEFLLAELVQNVHLFGFIAGYEPRIYKEQDPANIEAAERMGKLHDALKDIGYKGHALEVYLVRLLFCLFAEDTGIFERTQFQEYIDLHTKEDGSDVAMHLDALFEVLNTPKEARLSNLNEALNAFPYTNGKLFEERLRIAAFTSEMRQLLLYACSLDWSKISPAIFGAMFQAVMNPKERRNLGAHYTSEKNIQKVIKPLFLDALYLEFEKAKGSTPRLQAFHEKLSKLFFLDPACGCGNFLIIAYRELRTLEMQVLKALNTTGQGFLDISALIKVDVNQFAGIEYDEFPARIAEVAMWLIDHQMNMEVSLAFGQYYARLPLKNAAIIVHGNALTTDWEVLIPKQKLSFIVGNPPFVGAMIMSEQQREDINLVFHNKKGIGVLDYVTAWYLKAAQFIQKTNIKVAFVSTNSIAQGEQVGILWSDLLNTYKIKIHFAHRTFSWSNEAKGNAAVHCIIIGFAAFDIEEKYLFDYEDIKGEPQVAQVKNINPYLVNGADIIVRNQTNALANVPAMRFGSMPRDGGNFIFTKEEKDAFLLKEPNAAKWIRPYTGAQEFINGYTRYCLWLVDIKPNELKAMPEVLKRVEKVKDFRLASSAASTRNFANTPTLFCQIAQPDTNYILVPRVSSERRKYIPIGFINKDTIGNDQVLLIPNATLFLFGQLTSAMHLTWVKYVCGRLKSDYRYSNTIVYNNYPFPQNVTDTQGQKVEAAAQMVLDVRAKYPDSSLADLYDSLAMPPDLVKAHQALDKAVDLCYRPQVFTNEANRIEYLFLLYSQYSEPMFAADKKKKGGKK
ncbi:MAG: class I SAM-dependent DNA methyltransferase [Bacteroidia bacterium]